MKRVCSLLLACVLCAFCAGCSQPDALTLDLSQGYGRHTKLIHLNASSAEKEARLQAFYQVLEEADPLEKDPSLFAYYPDYLLELTDHGTTTTAVVDINGDFIDFYYPSEDGQEPQQLYRSHVTAPEFRKLVHQN